MSDSPDWEYLYRMDEKRIATLEAENAECEEWGKAEARMKERAEATIERLKVCILCGHCIEFAGNLPPSCNAPDTIDDEGAFGHPVQYFDICHFAPSRWTARAEPARLGKP